MNLDIAEALTTFTVPVVLIEITTYPDGRVVERRVEVAPQPPAQPTCKPAPEQLPTFRAATPAPVCIGSRCRPTIDYGPHSTF